MAKRTETILKDIFNNLKIVFEGNEISKEKLLNAYTAFLASTSLKTEHNVDLVIHTGSILFDIITVLHATFLSYLCNESQSDEEVLENLQPQSIVIYQKERWHYLRHENKNNRNYIVIANEEKGETTFVPEGFWKDIHPYGGNATKLGKHGVRIKDNNVSKAKLSKILEIAGVSDVPNTIETSAVIVMAKHRADRILNGVSFKTSGVNIPLLDIVTAAFYTNPKLKIDYPGNSYKTEPILKITSKLANARKILIDRNATNENIGLLILGNEQIKRSMSEIPEMMRKKSLQYMIMLGNVNNDFAQDLVDEYPEINLFACTKKLLQLYSVKPPKTDRGFINQLYKQTQAILQHEIEPIFIESNLKKDDFYKIRNNLKIISKSDFETDDKKNFIIQSYSFLKLLRNICFPLKYLNEEEIQNRRYGTPEEKLGRLKLLPETFPGYLKDKADEAVKLLEIFYSELLKTNNKQVWLVDFIKNSEASKNVAIVVPSSYMVPYMKRYFYQYTRDSKSNFIITTANKLDPTKYLDILIVVGLFDTNNFDAFKNRLTKKVMILTYGFAEYQFKKRQHHSNKDEAFYNKNLAKIYKKDVEYFSEKIEEPELTEEESAEIDSEIETYITNSNENFLFRSAGARTGGNILSECVLSVTFENGERCFFSKMYKPYVFDEDNGVVKETELNELVEGDNIVFTRRSNRTSDVVEDILEKLLEDGKLSKEIAVSYEKSKYWKQALRDYKNSTGCTSKTIASNLKEAGISVQEMTIKQWLTPESHTVGPRDEKTFQLIGKVVADEDMINNYNSYVVACDTVRKVRRGILSDVGKAIINKLQNKKPAPGSAIAEIYDKLDDLAEILKVESIIKIEKSIPSTLANRPLNLRNEL